MRTWRACAKLDPVLDQRRRRAALKGSQLGGVRPKGGSAWPGGHTHWHLIAHGGLCASPHPRGLDRACPSEPHRCGCPGRATGAEGAHASAQRAPTAAQQVSLRKPAAPPPPPQVRITGRRPTTAASAHYGSRTMSRTTSASSPTRPGRRVGEGGSAGQREALSKSPDRGTHPAPGPPRSPTMTPWTPSWSKAAHDNRDALVFGAELDAWERALMGM